MSGPQLPLTGIRVIDLSTYVPGPYASMLLADFGAEVIAVESPAGDPARSLPQRIGDDSALHSWLGRGKSSIRLDLKSTEGRARLDGLLAEADVLIEGFTPGVTARLGIDADTLRAAHPRLIYCSISGEGSSGSTAPGHDINYTARSGLSSQLTDAEGYPVPSGALIADMSGGLHALVGVLVALIERDRSGLGQVIDVSLLGGAMAFAGHQIMKALSGHSPQRGIDLNLGGDPAYLVYRTSDDRYISIGSLEEKFWDRLCRVLERPELREARTSDPVGTRRELERIFATRTRAEWESLLEPAGVCFAPVNDLEEALADPRVAAAGLVERGASGRTLLRNPIRLSRTPADDRRPAP